MLRMIVPKSHRNIENTLKHKPYPLESHLKLVFWYNENNHTHTHTTRYTYIQTRIYTHTNTQTHTHNAHTHTPMLRISFKVTSNNKQKHTQLSTDTTLWKVI